MSTDAPLPIQLTIDEAIDRVGTGRFQHRILLAAGLCFAADSMEVLLLSFLAVVVQAEWNLTDDAAASITSSVFLGAMVGTLILGPLGDKVGRKPVFVMSAATIAVLGVLTAVVQNLWQLLVVRFGVGMGVGGLVIPFDSMAEFVPTSTRGRQLLYLGYFWTLGTLLVPVLALLSLGDNTNGDQPDGHWRLFVLLCAIPCLVSVLLALIWVPESPHWLVSQGKTIPALNVLRSAATLNGIHAEAVLPPDTNVTPDPTTEVHSIWGLLSPQWRMLTLKLWATWFGFAFLYYGTVILITLIFAEGEFDNDGTTPDGSYDFDYVAILTAASAEVVGQTFVLLTVETWGRVHTQALSYLLGGMSVMALALLAKAEASRGVLMMCAFLARMFMMGSSSTTWVSTAELLPTEIRNTGHAAANAVARIGGALSPFVVSPRVPLEVVGAVMGGVSLVTCILSWNLPETQGKALGTAHTDSFYQHQDEDAAAATSTTIGNNNNQRDGSYAQPHVEMTQGGTPNQTKEII